MGLSILVIPDHPSHFEGLKTSQSYTVPLLGSLGSVSLSIAYFGYAFANLFVPSMVSMFKNDRFAMACAAMEYPYDFRHQLIDIDCTHSCLCISFLGCVLCGPVYMDLHPL